MMQMASRLVLAMGSLGLLAAEPVAAQEKSKCSALAFKAAGKAALARSICNSKAVKNGVAVDPSCVALADAKLALKLAKAAKKGDCLAAPNAEALRSIVETFDASVQAALGPVAIACCFFTAGDPGGDEICANVPSGATDCFGIPDFAPTEGQVCDGATGFCAAQRTGTSGCCQVPAGLSSPAAPAFCAEGPSVGLSCASPRTFFPGAVCLPTGLCAGG